jgi:hypothetical protein
MSAWLTVHVYSIIKIQSFNEYFMSKQFSAKQYWNTLFPSKKIFKWAITGVRNNTETRNNPHAQPVSLRQSVCPSVCSLHHTIRFNIHLYNLLSIHSLYCSWPQVSNKTSVSLTQFQLQLREEIKSQQQHYTFVRVRYVQRLITLLSLFTRHLSNTSMYLGRLSLSM